MPIRARPAYRAGGPLTVTDANVMLGRIQPGALSARVRRRTAASRSTPGSWPPEFAALAAEIGAATGTALAPEEVAAGFLDIAVANMANAIKKISVQRGYDVTEYVLATFGGAGGQHACAVADALGMTSVLIHPLAGVLSALGLGLADVTATREAGGRGAARARPLLPELDRDLRRPAGGSAASSSRGAGADPGPVSRPSAAPT